MEQIKIPSQEPYKQDITDYLNLLFGKTEESKVYWREGIKLEITASFGENSLFPEETSKGIFYAVINPKTTLSTKALKPKISYLFSTASNT